MESKWFLGHQRTFENNLSFVCQLKSLKGAVFNTCVDIAQWAAVGTGQVLMCCYAAFRALLYHRVLEHSRRFLFLSKRRADQSPFTCLFVRYSTDFCHC